MSEAPRLLLVEDDPELGAMLEELLGSEGYYVSRVRDGQSALHSGLSGAFDVFVLDRGLPVINGLDVLVKLRAAGVTTPTLILSALANPIDRIDGLDAGAEDYVVKPFDVGELLARLRALLRRHTDAADRLSVPGGDLDRSSWTVETPDGKRVQLSEREFALYDELARNPSRVFTRTEILESTFPTAEDTGVVDTYVHYLRRKLGRSSIQTIHGLGYRLGSLQ